MKSVTQARTSRPRATAPVVARRGPHLNALKHGLRSGSVLLPGDDVAAFRTLRQRLFHLYQPRTIEESQCVETVAASHWRIARCRVEQAVFKAHLGAVMSGDPAATGYVCDPDPHALHHRSMDCVLEEARLEKFKSRAQAMLALLQKQRTQSLSAMNPGALEDYRIFLAEGEPAAEEKVEPEAVQGTAGAAAEAADTATPATGESDWGNGKIRKRESAPAAPRFPKHWSRGQREAATRRMAEASNRTANAR